MKSNRLLFCCLLITGFGSCDHVCPPAVLNIAFRGYVLSEVDTLIIKKYQKNSGFTVLKDTYTISNTDNTFIYVEKEDSIGIHSRLVLDDKHYKYLESGYDWEISIPSQPRTMKISNIIVDQMEDRSKRCVSPIASYTLDGQFRKPFYTGNEDRRFYYGGYWVVVEK